MILLNIFFKKNIHIIDMIHKIYSGKYNFWGVLNGSSKLLNISSTNNFFPYCIINIHFALKTEKPPLPSETPSYGLVIYLLFFLSPFCHGALRKTWDKVFKSGPRKTAFEKFYFFYS